MCYYPHAFLKKRKWYCNRLHPSVHPSCYLLLNHWTKFNQIWCVSYWHELGVQRQTFFGPAPWGPGEGSKGQISFNFNYKVNLKDFYTKLCVCSHKHIRRDFHSVPLVKPQGWDFGVLGGTRGVQKIFFQTWSSGISNRRGWRAEQNASKIFILGSNWWPWNEVKGQISLNFGYHVNFKGFYTKFCVCSHKLNIQNISDRIFILSPGSCPRSGTLGHWGYPGGQTFFFQHGHVAYQIDGDDEQNKMQVIFSS